MAGSLGLVFKMNALGASNFSDLWPFDKKCYLGNLHALLAASMTNVLLVYASGYSNQ